MIRKGYQSRKGMCKRLRSRYTSLSLISCTAKKLLNQADKTLTLMLIQGGLSEKGAAVQEMKEQVHM